MYRKQGNFSVVVIATTSCLVANVSLWTIVPERFTFVRTSVQYQPWMTRALQDSIGTGITGCIAGSTGFRLPRSKCFLRDDPRIAPDLKHAHLEDRLIAVGRTEKGRPLFVAFTIRERFGQQMIRPVSARYMHAKEIKSYETQGS